MASGRPRAPQQHAEQTAAPTSTCITVQKSLANREPSTDGYKQLSQGALGDGELGVFYFLQAKNQLEK